MKSENKLKCGIFRKLGNFRTLSFQRASHQSNRLDYLFHGPHKIKPSALKPCLGTGEEFIDR